MKMGMKKQANGSVQVYENKILTMRSMSVNSLQQLTFIGFKAVRDIDTLMPLLVGLGR